VDVIDLGKEWWGVNPAPLYRYVLQFGSRNGSISVRLVVYGVLEGFALANNYAATEEYDYFY
jgi:hypothetical protein